MTILYLTKEMGLCNRLRGLVAALALSSRTKKPLHVLWIPNHECPYQFQEMFEVPKNTTFITESERLEKYDLITDDMGHLCHLLPKQGLAYTMAPLLISMLTLNQKVMDLIKEKGQTFNISECIGLHIRKTDHVAYANTIGKSTPLEEFFQVVDNHKENIYLACDDLDIQKQFIEKYGDRIKYFSIIGNPTDFRQTDGIHAIVDIYLLSLCKFFKGSYASSFSAHVSYLMEAWAMRPTERNKFF